MFFFLGGVTPAPFWLLQNGLNPNPVCCNGPEVMGERFHLLFRNWVLFLSKMMIFLQKIRRFPIKHGDFPANMAIFLRRKLIFSVKTGDFPIAMLLFEQKKTISFLEVLSIAPHHRASIDIGAWWLQELATGKLRKS